MQICLQLIKRFALAVGARETRHPTNEQPCIYITFDTAVNFCTPESYPDHNRPFPAYASRFPFTLPAMPTPTFNPLTRILMAGSCGP
jgi:hypothetical protein